jgi:hypothetical protein
MFHPAVFVLQALFNFNGTYCHTPFVQPLKQTIPFDFDNIVLHLKKLWV